MIPVTKAAVGMPNSNIQMKLVSLPELQLALAILLTSPGKVLIQFPERLHTLHGQLPSEAGCWFLRTDFSFPGAPTLAFRFSHLLLSVYRLLMGGYGRRVTTDVLRRAFLCGIPLLWDTGYVRADGDQRRL